VTSGERLLDVTANIFTRTDLALHHDKYGPRSVEADCNAAFDVEDAGWPLLFDGGEANLYADPGFLDPDGRDYRLGDGSAVAAMTCYDTLDTGGPAFELAPGAYGGPLGNWYGQTITLEELEGMFEVIFLP
jgi:hypothetical protein